MTILIDADGCPVLIRTILPQKRHQPEPVPFVGGDGGIRTQKSIVLCDFWLFRVWYNVLFRGVKRHV